MTMAKSLPILALILAVTTIGSASAFVPPAPKAAPQPLRSLSSFVSAPPSSILRRPSPPRTRLATRTRTNTRTNTGTTLHSLFGLGLPEIGIVLLAGLLVMGPSKLVSAAKDAGTIAGKTASGLEGNLGEYGEGLKRIPEEFVKGVEEGEVEARSRKAKVMGEVGKADGNDDE